MEDAGVRWYRLRITSSGEFMKLLVGRVGEGLRFFGLCGMLSTEGQHVLLFGMRPPFNVGR